MTRITDLKIRCVYIHVYQIIKSQGPLVHIVLYVTLIKKYFLRLPFTQNWREAHIFHLAREKGKIWWEKGNFIMINEIKYGQNWIIWHLQLVYHLQYLSIEKSVTQIFFQIANVEWYSEKLHKIKSADVKPNVIQ